MLGILLSALHGHAQTAGKIDFKRDIEPIFNQRCVGCHGATVQSSGLRLDRREDALRGGYSGAVILPGKAPLARRMVERGVRFVLLTHTNWDDHDNLNSGRTRNCRVTDQPAAALLRDLKQRGLLDQTLVVWGGEFGRTPIVETLGQTDPEKIGRDHHPLAYTMWLAGGGIRGGQVVGKTDDFCMSILEDPVHVHDLQATMLHCLGFDHTRLRYRSMGRDFRLTDVEGNVVRKLLV